MKPKPTWRGVALFCFIYYVYRMTAYSCGGWVAFSFAVCVVFLVFARPLILGDSRRYFKHETKREDIPVSMPRGEEIYAEPDDDDLP